MKTLRDIRFALGRAFRSKEGVFGAISGFLLVLLSAIMLPSLSLIRFVLSSSHLTAGVKLSTLGGIIWESRMFLTKPAGLVAIAFAFVFAANMALLVHFVRCRARLAKRAAGASVIGFIAGLLGVGCAPCGSVLLVSVIGTGAATALLGALPLHGLEFGCVGLIAVAVSIVALSRRIAAPEVCVVPLKK